MCIAQHVNGRYGYFKVKNYCISRRCLLRKGGKLGLFRICMVSDCKGWIVGSGDHKPSFTMCLPLSMTWSCCWSFCHSNKSPQCCLKHELIFNLYHNDSLLCVTMSNLILVFVTFPLCRGHQGPDFFPPLLPSHLSPNPECLSYVM